LPAMAVQMEIHSHLGDPSHGLMAEKCVVDPAGKKIFERRYVSGHVKIAHRAKDDLPNHLAGGNGISRVVNRLEPIEDCMQKPLHIRRTAALALVANILL